MDTATKNRLIGFNSLLYEIFDEEMLISQILDGSSLTKTEIEIIKTKHLKEYLKTVTQNVYNYFSAILPNNHAGAIRFCYYFNGKQPNLVQKENQAKILQLQTSAVSGLKQIINLNLFINILTTTAKDILKYDQDYLKFKAKMNSRRQMIKSSAERIKHAKKYPHWVPKRPPSAFTESEKKKILKQIEKNKKTSGRVFKRDEPKRKMFNPWLGSKRYKDNWW